MIFQVHGILRGSRISPLQRSFSSVFTCGNGHRKKSVGKRSFSLFSFFLWGSDSNSRLGSDIWGCDRKITDSVSGCGKLAEQAK
jgi:hypothetical protein